MGAGGRWSPPGFSFRRWSERGGVPRVEPQARCRAPVDTLITLARKHCLKNPVWSLESVTRHKRTQTFSKEPLQCRGGQEREEGMLERMRRCLVTWLWQHIRPPRARHSANVCACVCRVLHHWTSCFRLNISSLPVCIQQTGSPHSPRAWVRECGCVCLCGSVWVFW